MRYLLKVSVLNKSAQEYAYKVSWHGKYGVFRGGHVEFVEEWVKFRVIVKE